MRVLFLDIDGVLNRTGFHPGESVGLRSWIEPDLARRLDDVLRATGAVIVLASAWRQDRDLAHLRDELRAAGVEDANGLALADIAIVDDGYDMGPLAARFVRCSPLSGLDDSAAAAVIALFASA